MGTVIVYLHLSKRVSPVVRKRHRPDSLYQGQSRTICLVRELR